MNKNNHILLWVSGKTLKDYLSLLECWKYEYMGFLLVWVKINKSNGLPKAGLGYWSRNNCEFLILAK